MLTYTGLRAERVLASRQQRDGRFHNTFGVTAEVSGATLKTMGEFAFGGRKRRPDAPIPVFNPLDGWRRRPSSPLRVTWLGHSSMLFEIDAFRVLIDPVFGERASPFSFVGAKRMHPAPVAANELPSIDVVLLSHDHYDHLCESTMRQIAKLRIPIVTSLGVGLRLERLGVDPALITELDWWESHEMFGGALSFTATPAQHFSGRWLNDRNFTLWSSWVVRTDNVNVFFSGDTGLNNELGEIAKRFGPFDFSIYEIGASNPAWASIHLGPANALKAFEMMGGGTMMPVHWATFDLALHNWSEPAETLLTLANRSGARVLTPMIGKPFEPSQLDVANPWWRAVTRANAAAGIRTRISTRTPNLAGDEMQP